jgi:hypothetical protein
VQGGEKARGVLVGAKSWEALNFLFLDSGESIINAEATVTLKVTVAWISF